MQILKFMGYNDSRWSREQGLYKNIANPKNVNSIWQNMPKCVCFCVRECVQDEIQSILSK